MEPSVVERIFYGADAPGSWPIPPRSPLIPDLLFHRTDAIVEFILLMTSDALQRGRATAAASRCPHDHPSPPADSACRSAEPGQTSGSIENEPT
jgi:hypothetical protein